MAPGDPPAGYDRVTPFYIVMIVINALVGIVAQPHHMEIAGAGKTELEGRVGFTFGNMLKRICTLAWALTGVACIALYPDLADSEHAFGLASRDLLPVGLVGVMLASMVAAAMSSCDSLMVDGSAPLREERLPTLPATRGIGPALSQRGPAGRLVGVAVVMGGIVVATYATTVVGILKLTWSLVAFFGIAFWGGVLWRRCNAYGAWAGILGSSLLWYLSRFVWGWELHQQFLVYLVGGFFCMIVVSLLHAAGRQETARPLLCHPAHAHRRGAPPAGSGHPAGQEVTMWDLEVSKPSKQTVVGFLLAWVCVIAIILFTLFLVRIGA